MSEIIIKLEPEDEFNHTPDEVSNYNESMYFNVFDHSSKIGGWFRLGNRPNEGYAEMTCCLYLPDGKIGFMFGRPSIDSNELFNAGGMEFKVLEPFKKLAVSYTGRHCCCGICPCAFPQQARIFRYSAHAAHFPDCSFHAIG